MDHEAMVETTRVWAGQTCLEIYAETKPTAPSRVIPDFALPVT